MSKRWALLLLLVGIFVSTSGAQSDTSDFCDPALETVSENPNRYQERDAGVVSERCEGLYIRKMSSSVIGLTSFTKTNKDFTVGQDVELSWVGGGSPPTDNTLHIRADSQVYRLYYRMDTRVPVDGKSFAWPTSIVAALGMTADDVGLAAWQPTMLGDVERDVYLPLSVAQDGVSHGDGYQIAIVPLVELTKVEYSVAAESKRVRGYRDETAVFEESLPVGFYPNGRPITIDFDLEGEGAGVYHLMIEGIPRDAAGDPNPGDPLGVWFYHEGD